MLLISIGLLKAGSTQTTPPVQPATPVHLARVYKEHEKSSYHVDAVMTVEQRQMGEGTWFPQRVELSYPFSSEVLKLQSDDVAVCRYVKGKTQEDLGESVDSGPSNKTLDNAEDMDLTISNVNEVISFKKHGSSSNSLLSAVRPPFASGLAQQDAGQLLSKYLETFTGEVYRLALCEGSFDSGIDFSPKLPLPDVKPGDTWNKTVGFTPNVAGSAASLQRLDYVYTYQGLVAGGKIRLVKANLHMVGDLAELFHKVTGTTSEQTGLKRIPIELWQTIFFSLDPQTCKTTKAVATSAGQFSVELSQFPGKPILEQKLKGTTTMTLDKN